VRASSSSAASVAVCERERAFIDHIISISQAQVEEMYAHAREVRPEECCGLVGGREGEARNVYRLRNVSEEPERAYSASIKDLIDAQKLMRERGEELLGIYHSHPNSSEPAPSETDVRLAYHPSAIYFIIGFTDEDEARLRAFRFYMHEGRSEAASFRVSQS
jgi:proteasome lid subunit RPN8/RPN11